MILPMLGYLIEPGWVGWARFSPPLSLRWGALALSLVCLLALISVLRTLGENITPVEFTREEHQLVMSGPYRWIRHPLYTFGGVFWTSLGVLSGLWPVVLGFTAIIILLALRVPREEEELEKKFGERYRQYREKTGRFFPRLSLSR